MNEDPLSEPKPESQLEEAYQKSLTELSERNRKSKFWTQDGTSLYKRFEPRAHWTKVALQMVVSKMF